MLSDVSALHLLSSLPVSELMCLFKKKSFTMNCEVNISLSVTVMDTQYAMEIVSILSHHFLVLL